MHRRDKGRELVEPDLVPPNMRAAIFAASSRFLDADGGSSGILALPVEIDKIPHPAKSRCRNRISIEYNAAPLTSFWFLPSKQPPPEFCGIDLGGRKRDIQR